MARTRAVLETTKDNCPFISNKDQKDTDGNHRRLMFSTADLDGDGFPDKVIPYDANGNAVGSTPIAGDPVMVGGMPVIGDNCPTVSNPQQIDSTNSGVGDACNTSYCYVVDRAQPSKCLDHCGLHCQRRCRERLQARQRGAQHRRHLHPAALGQPQG